jgi:phosphoenolpyruvate synthase/pyruvate phosphate dikinase
MITDVAEAPALGRVEVGGKAAVLAELSAAGFPVPPGVVVTAAAFDEPGFDALLASAARSLGAERFAVRSSGVAEDLADASYAGLYETYLDVPADDLAEAVRRCFAAALSERVIAYHDRRGGSPAAMAVLVQEMVDASAAGVAFTAHPVTGDREQTIITAVAGLGDPVVSGTQSGEEWVVTTTDTTQTRRSSSGGVLNAQQVRAVAELARQVADRYDGQPRTSSGQSTRTVCCGCCRRVP